MRKALFLIALPLAAQTLSLSGLELKNAAAQAVSFQGKNAIQLNESPGAPKDALAVVKGTRFHNGVIEVDVAGDKAKGASPTARGFVGIAFRVNGEKYECFYIRPANGRANDQLQRNHSTQYVSSPDYPWDRLRKEDPGKYESYADLQLGVWTKLRVTVSGSAAQLYVNGAPQPALIVNDLKLGDTEGAIALWIGSEAEGHFANLRVTRQ